MRFLKILLPLVALLLWSVTAKADYNPTNPPEPGVYFTLTTRCVPQDGGYGLARSATYAFGTKVQLYVYPNSGYRFAGWKDEEGNVVSTSGSFYYTMPAKDVTLTAHFVYDPSNPQDPSTPVIRNESRLKFEISPADGGRFGSNYDGTYEVGSSQSFYAYSNTGYRFLNWTKDGEVIGTSSSLRYTVPKGDHTLVANFEYSPGSPAEPGEPHFYRKLSLVSNPEAAATLSGSGTYLDGERVYVSMYVNDYYRFVNWTDENGEVVSTQRNFYYTMPNRKVTLTANFTYNYNPSSPGEPGTPDTGSTVGDRMVLWPRFGMADDSHVRILCETPGSTIHYTLDGSDPMASSPVYTGPVYVGSNLLVKAIAMKEGLENSPIVSFRVSTYKADAPMIAFENKKIKITCDIEDALIRYTLDGNEPDTTSMVYTGPFLPDVDCTVKAYATKENFNDSPVANYVYRKAEHTLPVPTFKLDNDGKLTIVAPLDDCVTRYTTDGSAPDSSSPVFAVPLSFLHNCTVRAYCTHDKYLDSPVATYEVNTFAVNAPSITFENKKVKITCDSKDAVIRYTIDGNKPDATSPVYTAPFLPENDCTVRAYAAKENFHDSPVTDYVFRRADHTLAMPTFTINSEEKLVITPQFDDCVTRYTTDGSAPDSSSPVYEGPISISHNCTVRAYCTHDKYLDSPIASYRFDSFTVNAPAITFENRKVKIVCDRQDAVIRYTLDGNNPNEESPVYTEPFLPENDCTVKAYAAKENFNDSPVTDYVYIRADHTLAAPVFSLDAEKKLVITPAVSGCETRYTADGSEPDNNSSLYAGPVELSDHGSVKAYSTLDNYFDSPVAEYVIAEHQVSAPTMTADFRNRRIFITQPESLRVSLKIDGNAMEIQTPDTLDVTPAMSEISAIAIAAEADRLNSVATTETLVFHKKPVLAYDGHAVHYRLADDEPQAEGAEGWAYFNDNLRQYGEPVQSIDVYEFGKATAHIESDRAFRSDDATMPIEVFNTGRMAGAINGHRLSEAFGTWGDTPEEYTYLRVIGEVEKEDLQFIATLPALTTLHLDPYSMTEEECDGVFAATRIETLFSTAFPEGMLRGMPRLTTLMWGLTNAKMPEGIVAEAGNPNILLWVTDAANAPDDARNVVVYDYAGEGIPTDPEGPGIEGRAESIMLIAGYPFNAFMPVTAAHAVVAKEFTQPTQIGVCQGWETIALPFEAQRITRGDGREIVPFEIWDGQDASPKPFWLYSATSDDWQQAGSIEAGVPYIISMPNNPDYIEDYNISGIVRFSADNVTLGIEESAPKTSDWKDGMLFKAIFMPAGESGMLSLNTHGEGGRVPGSAFISEAYTLPFGAYVAGAGSRKAVPVFGDSGVMALPSGPADSLAIDASIPGVIRVSSMSDRHITVHDLTGAIVARTEVRAGESVAIERLTRGAYLVAGKKVMVR